MLPTSVRIMLCTEAQDMRRSFDTLALVVRRQMGEDPQGGTLYVFVGKRPTRVKVLWWDRNGFCLLYKRLHCALFDVPVGQAGVAAIQISGNALAELLAAVGKEAKSQKAA